MVIEILQTLIYPATIVSSVYIMMRPWLDASAKNQQARFEVIETDLKRLSDKVGTLQMERGHRR